MAFSPNAVVKAPPVAHTYEVPKFSYYQKLGEATFGKIYSLQIYHYFKVSYFD